MGSGSGVGFGVTFRVRVRVRVRVRASAWTAVGLRSVVNTPRHTRGMHTDEYP